MAILVSACLTVLLPMMSVCLCDCLTIPDVCLSVWLSYCPWCLYFCVTVLLPLMSVFLRDCLINHDVCLSVWLSYYPWCLSVCVTVLLPVIVLLPVMSACLTVLLPMMFVYLCDCLTTLYVCLSVWLSYYPWCLSVCLIEIRLECRCLQKCFLIGNYYDCCLWAPLLVLTQSKETVPWSNFVFFTIKAKFWQCWQCYIWENHTFWWVFSVVWAHNQQVFACSKEGKINKDKKECLL